MHPVHPAPPAANAVRPPAFFSQATPPARIMVVDRFGHPVGLGNIIARHTLQGHLTGYAVALDSGQRIPATAAEIFSAENIINPPRHIWHRQNPNHPCALPPGAA